MGGDVEIYDADIGDTTPAGVRPVGDRLPFSYEAAAKIVDVKGLTRPPQFDGTSAKWNDFKFKMEAIASMVGLDIYLNAARLETDAKLASLTGDVPRCT